MLAVFTRLADALTWGLLGLEPGSPTGEAVHFFIEDSVKIFVLLAAIVFAMGFLRAMISPERVRELVAGRPRFVSYPLAVTLGAVTPFCSCSSVPLFIGFLEAGIPLGVTMAFLIASPMINEVAVVLLAAVLGWKVTALYIAAGLATGLMGGLLIEALKLEGWVEDYVWKIRMGKVFTPRPDTSWRGRLAFARQETAEILRRIWKYVLIGIAAGALLHGFVPAQALLRVAGADNPLAVPAAALIGIPLYSSASGVIPVVESLIAKGLPMGTVLTLMMSVAAISLPEMIILRKVLKPRLIATFCAILFVAFVCVGYLFNFLFA